MNADSNVLIHEPPVHFSYSLATQIGHNEAIFLERLHEWIKIDMPRLESEQDRDRKTPTRWAYWGTHKDIQRGHFPFWSKRQIRRIIVRLEEQRIVVSEKSSEGNLSKGKRYAIDYDVLNKVVDLRLTDELSYSGRCEYCQFEEHPCLACVRQK